MARVVDNICTIRETHAAEFESCEYYSVSTCTTAVHSFQKPIFTAAFVLLIAKCFLLVRTALPINSHLTQTFMCATRDIKTMLLDFFLSVYKQLPVY